MSEKEIFGEPVLRHIGSFSKGDIVKKLLPSKDTLSMNSDMGIQTEVEIGLDTNYMAIFYKVIEVNNGIAYLEMLDKYIKNKIIAVNILKYGQGWVEVNIPEGYKLVDGDIIVDKD